VNSCKMKILLVGITVILVVCLFGPGFPGAENFSPYNYFPEGTYRAQDWTEQKTPVMIEVLPHTPMLITDSDENKMYISPEGKVMLKIDKQGNRMFFMKGLTHHEEDSDGNLTVKFRHTKGTNKVEVQNEFREKIGAQELGLGNKVVREYDENNKPTKSYEYNKYGKRITWIVDELTLTKIECDEQGKPLWDIDFEGNKVAWYSYNEQGKLMLKEDVYGNKTYYDKKGMSHTVDCEGNIITTYNYAKDEYGYLVLSSAKDEIRGNITLFDNGRPQEVKNSAGAVIKKYEWKGTKLIYTLDVETNEVTWYENGRPTYTSYDDFMVRQWFYFDGKIAGFWNHNTSSFLLYTHGREEVEFLCEDEPTEQQIRTWVSTLETTGDVSWR